jgi:hypothetical protein
MKEEFPRLNQNPWTRWPTDLLLDLQHCGDCVIEYHRIRDDFVNNEPHEKKVGIYYFLITHDIFCVGSLNSGFESDFAKV